MAHTRRALNLYLLAALGATASFTRAQPSPERLSILCGYPAGGSVDVVSRKLGEKVAQRTGAPAIIENRPGAAGRLAVQDLKKAPAGGRSLLVTPASVMTMYPHVYAQLGYDVFTDVQPVCTVAATAFALAVGPAVPASITTLEGFVAWCRANRAAAQCGNAGAGSMPHFMAILFGREAGIDLDHIPFRGGSAAMQAVAAGDLAAALGTESSAMALYQAGKLRVLATSAAERTRAFPQAPTFRERGHPALMQREWFGVFAPAGESRDVIARMGDLLRQPLGDRDVRDTWDRLGLQPDALDAGQLQAALRREYDFWGPLVRSSGFKPES
jgi:tripartite-type tricarboxylate transporter receptor subunit TctC